MYCLYCNSLSDAAQKTILLSQLEFGVHDKRRKPISNFVNTHFMRYLTTKKKKWIKSSKNLLLIQDICEARIVYFKNKVVIKRSRHFNLKAVTIPRVKTTFSRGFNYMACKTILTNFTST